MRTALAFALALAGCTAATPDAASPRATDTETPRARPRSDNPWIGCYRSFEPSDDPAADLARLADTCAARAGYVAVTPVFTGALQAEGDPPERFSFRARAGRCYRFFAVGEPSGGARGVDDLDVAVFDSEGRLASADVSDDRWPIVPPRGPLCAGASGPLTITIAVTRGSGSYLFQVWGSGEDDDAKVE